MNFSALSTPRLDLALGARAAVATAAYGAAAAAILLTVILLRGVVSGVVLRAFLGYVLIAQVSAGLEPGTVKAAALGPAGVDAASPWAYLAAGAVKGLLASPVLALLWKFADPAATAPLLAWAPAVAVAGFCATDLRVLSDLRGRHALAIGLKQGSLAGGVLVAGLVVAFRAPLTWGVAAACLGRLALIGLAVDNGLRRGDAGDLWREVRRLFGDRRWLDLAAVSLIAAASGSTDRVFGLRYLSPVTFGGYYLVYELFSRFWLIPYVLSPILFARRAAGGSGVAFVRGAWGLTAVAGTLFLAVTAGVILLASALLARLIGVSFGLPVLAFAAAVVVSSFGQLRLAELQGAGRSRRAAVAAGVGAVVSVPLFFLMVRAFGAPGLMFAWLAKACVELAVLMAGGAGRALAPQSV